MANSTGSDIRPTTLATSTARWPSVFLIVHLEKKPVTVIPDRPRADQIVGFTSPVASAISGLPENNMADVIDSLKRLERLGDENSKTVQKILEAAREIESRIVKLYDQYPDGVTISGANAFKFPKPSFLDSNFDGTEQITKGQLDLAQSLWENEVKASGISPDLYDVSYSIVPRGSGSARCLMSCGPGGVKERVSENRDAAIRFGDDIAKGLLVVIAADLASQKGDNERALSVLSKAKEALAPTETNTRIEVW